MSKKENKHDIGKSALQNIKEESLRKQQALEQEQLELRKQAEKNEKQKREAHDKKLMEEKRELIRLKQGVIEESTIIPENVEEEEVKLTLWSRIKSFFYLNKWWLGLACFAVLLCGFFVKDLMTRPNPDMVILLIGQHPSIGENSYLSDYFASFAEDFNDNGKVEAEVYYIPYNSEDSYVNYSNGSDTKLTTQMQIADAVIIIADDAFKKLIDPDSVLADLTELFPNDEHIKDKYYYQLKDTDIAKHIGVAPNDIKDDMYIAVRKPQRVLYSNPNEMQKTYDKDIPVLERVIADLSK